jgi:hypothetical protein
MTPDEMQTRVVAVLGRFNAVRHDVLRREVLCLGGHYNLVAAQSFDALIDEMTERGQVLRDQPHGWVRLARQQPGKPSQPAGRSRTPARLRSGSPATAGPGG